MIEASMATVIILVFIGVFGMILPVLDKIKRFNRFISFRWSVVVVLLAALVGVLIDFSHLDDSVRLAIVVGGLIIGGVFIVIRTWEKAAAKGWSLRVRKIEASKGDAKVAISIDDEAHQSSK